MMCWWAGDWGDLFIVWDSLATGRDSLPVLLVGCHLSTVGWLGEFSYRESAGGCKRHQGRQGTLHFGRLQPWVKATAETGMGCGRHSSEEELRSSIWWEISCPLACNKAWKVQSCNTGDWMGVNKVLAVEGPSGMGLVVYSNHPPFK